MTKFTVQSRGEIMQAMTTSRRFTVHVAAIGSAGAGLVHATAVGSHSEEQSLVWLFALCAIAQVGVAGAALLSPRRRVLLGLGLVNAAAFGCWALSRTVGLPAPAALHEVESVGTSDLIGALFALLAVGAAIAYVARPASKRVLGPAWTVLALVGALALSVPALAAGAGHHHDHNEAGAHPHDDHAGPDHVDHASHQDATHDHASAEVAGVAIQHDHSVLDAHEHSTVADPGAGHANHPSHATADPGHTDHPVTDPGHAHPPTTDPGQPTTTDPVHTHPPTTPTGPIVSVSDPRLTPQQRDAATRLLFTTLAGMSRFTDVASVEAAGYRSIGDSITGFEHFVNWTYYADGVEMDPDRIESMVFRVENGTKRLVSGMYILNPGKTMNDVPDIASTFTVWHDHQDLCWLTVGGSPRVVGLTRPDGSCAIGAFIGTPPMIHVWKEPQTCGPFAGIEGTHGDTCTSHTH